MLEIDALISSTLSNETQVKFFAEQAIKIGRDVQDHNERIIGHQVTRTTYVNGQKNASEYSITSSGGTIEYVFSITSDIVEFIADSIQKLSPVRSGQYKASDVIYADGVLVSNPNDLPKNVSEWIFVNTQPYAGKIERGESSQASHGVYELTAYQAAQKYPEYHVLFDFRYTSDSKYLTPAIVVTQGKH
jgi:hypothetical protein